MTGKIPREARHLLRFTFERCNCVLLLGPRQVGKTTLAKEFAKKYWTYWDPSRDYKDLEQEADRFQLNNIHAFIKERDRKVIVLDEAQCMHEIFPKLRTVLDNPTNSDCENLRWLILGSSTSELEALVNRNLAGRHKKIYLTPFQIPELNDAYRRLTTTSIGAYPANPELDLQTIRPPETHELSLDLWLKGGFPHSFQANDIQASLEWRSQFISDILGPHFPPRNNVKRPELLLPLWERLACQQGMCNIQKLSVELGCSKEILDNLLNFLETGNLIRKVRRWERNYRKRLNKSPLWFIRDSGLLHSQLNVKDIHSLKQMYIVGKSWEGFVLESILSVAPLTTEVFYFRDDGGNEVDFVLEFDASQRWVIEVKFSDNRGVSKGFYKACREVESQRQFVIHGGPESFKEGKNSLDSFCLYDAIRELKSVTKR